MKTGGKSRTRSSRPVPEVGAVGACARVTAASKTMRKRPFLMSPPAFHTSEGRGGCDPRRPGGVRDRRSLPVGHLAVTEGPVFFRDFDQADQKVFAAQAGTHRQLVGDRSVERALLLEGSAEIQRDLNQDDVVAPVDSQIPAIRDESGIRMLLKDLKTVLRRDVDRLDHRAMDRFADGGEVRG